MLKKLSLLILLASLLFVFSCDKSIPEPKPVSILTPEEESSLEKPLISNIPLSGLYYLYQVKDSYYGTVNPTNFLPNKDSLTIKFMNPTAIEISMRIGRDLYMFVDSCAIYSGIGKITTGSMKDKINFGELYGKSYYVGTGSYNTNPNPIPIGNQIWDFKTNGDTLKLKLFYYYYRWTQGKPSGGAYHLDLAFVKAS